MIRGNPYRQSVETPLERPVPMASKRGAKIFPHFWFVKEAEEAARFYASIFPDSRVERVFPFPRTRRAVRRVR